MGASRAASPAPPAVPRAGPRLSPSALLEFAAGQALDAGSGVDAGLAELLRHAVATFGCRAALAARLGPPQDPVLLAAYPPGAADPGLLAGIAGLLAQPGAAAADGCVHGRITLGGPHARRLASVLIGPGPRPGDGCGARYVLVLVAGRARWTAELRATARALAALIEARQRHAADRREIAERRAVAEALIGVSHDAVVIANAARRIVAVNPAAEELYGRPRASLLGRPMSELIPERNRARFLESTEEFLRSGDPGEFTGRLHLPILRADGSERTVELSPLPLVVGGQSYFCNFARDVTELERANAALALSEAQLRLLTQLAPVGIARTGVTGDCAFVNERWCVLTGRPDGYFPGRSWLDAVHPRDVARVRAEWGRAQAAGSELRTDFRLAREQAPPRWVHAAVAPLPEDADLPAGFMVALTNVTARKRAEAERDRLLAAQQATVRRLTDQTERLNSLLAAAIPGVLILDEDNVIMQANQSLCDLLGITERPARLAGRPGRDLLGPIRQTFADPDEVLSQIARYNGHHRVDGLEFGCADGRTLGCDYWPLLAGGEYRGGLLLVWDISERAAQDQERDRRLRAELASRRAAEQAQQHLSEQNDQLRELDDLKTRFLATVSHELRSPLAAIVSYADLLAEEETGLSAAGTGFLEVIQRNAERVTRLVGDLLLLSRMDAGVLPLELAPVAIGEIVAEAVQTAAPAAARQGVQLTGTATGGPPCQADRARLIQVLDNLIGNAVKFTDRGGQVTVTATATSGGRDWQIDVADTGIGIPDADVGQLFDRFYRASNATSTRRPGSGLGLSIVREIVERHGGRVTVRSSLGHGTTIRVRLPVRSPRAELLIVTSTLHKGIEARWKRNAGKPGRPAPRPRASQPPGSWWSRMTRKRPSTCCTCCAAAAGSRSATP